MNVTQSVLLYFLKHKVLTRTQVMKYLYLYEYIYRKHTGRPSTDLTFIRYDYGPFEQTVYDVLENFETQNLVAATTYINSYGKQSYEYRATFDEEVILNSLEQDVADYVLRELSGKSFQGMIDAVYSTPPMKKVLEREEELGQKLLGEVLSMSESKGIYKRTQAGKEAAIERLSTRERVRGTDEDYFNVIISEHKALEPLRRRVQDGTTRSN